MPKVGGKRRKARTHQELDEDDEKIMDNIPKSFIFKRGRVSNMMKHIVQDVREIMHPYCAINLKENDRTKIKEYIETSKTLGVSHLQIFTSTEKHNYLRYIKSPEGPTMTYKIISYCTRRDISNSQPKKMQFSRNFKAPVLVMSGFNKEITTKNIRNPPTVGHYQVVGQMIQSMFPALNLQKSKVSNIQRVVLYSYDNEKDVISLRHFHVQLVPVSSNKMMQKVFRSKNTPNLRDYGTFADFLNKKKGGSQNQSGNVSESEAEDAPDQKIELEKKSFKKQYTTKLTEIGPRLKLRLYKIEEGVLGGNVIYNRMVVKDGAEIEAQRKKIMEQRAEKEKRRLQQEQNVKKKKKEQKLKEKEKEKLKQQKQQSDQMKKDDEEEEEKNNGEFDEGFMQQLGGYDEPDEEEINDEKNGFFTKSKNGEDEELVEYRGVDEQMQDFDEEYSEEESEQFIRNLENQVRQLQKENDEYEQSEDEEEEDDEEEEEEDDNDEEEDDDNEDEE